MMEKKYDMSIADVADAAAVSVSTVSRILNNKPDVSEKTRQRVLAVIKELNYSPHLQAQRLASGQSRAIALLYPVEQLSEQPIDQLNLDFMVGAAAAAGNHQYSFNVITTILDEQTLLDLYRSVGVDGVILMEVYEEDRRVELLRKQGFPFVMIGQCSDNTGLNFIELDYKDSACLLMEHLINQGHTKIGFIGYSQVMREMNFGPAIRGFNGYLHSTKKHNLRPLIAEPMHQPQEMYEATIQLLGMEPELTSLVVLADASITGVYDALRSNDLKVPEDISVVGLGVDRIAEILSPRLTSVRFPSYNMGLDAAEMLIRILQEELQQETQVFIQPEIVIRESSGPVCLRS